MDFSNPEDGSNDLFFKLKPRLSFSYLTGNFLQNSLFKDVYLATQIEGSSAFSNYLAGVGVSLNVPRFSYASVNLYQVNNEVGDDDEQLNVSWGLPFSIASADFFTMASSMRPPLPEIMLQKPTSIHK